MSSDLALRTAGLGKMYRVRRATPRGGPTAATATKGLRRRFRRTPRDDFWALNDVSLEVNRGEILGIVGQNGAGKSTLLKLLSRVSPPTTGTIELFGRVGSLLEVGTGFHPELTGRENVYLNGTILGMRRRSIERHFDEIVAFSGVERFLDTPVKRYSSGMHVRLAFAVAAHLDTDILLVDEVLAVGDVAFQRKCLGKMGEVAHDGRTVLLVSHNLAVVSSLATRCVLVHQGRLARVGSAEEVLESYAQTGFSQPEARDLRMAHRPEDWHTREVELVEAELLSALRIFQADEPIQMAVTVLAHAPCAEPRLTYTLHRLGGEPVGTSFSAPFAPLEAGSTVSWHVELADLNVAPGRYYLTLAVGTGEQISGYEHFDAVTDVLHFEVAPQTIRGEAEVWHYGWGPCRLEPPRSSADSFGRSL